jgi:hypothetical protein
MIVYDFFSGTGSSTKAFEDAGHTIIKVELDLQFEAHERDILSLTAEGLIAKYGQPDFIWASPPCQKFSVASCSRYWYPDGTPRDDNAGEALKLVEFTINLIQELNPTNGYIIENPRGMLRKQKLMQPLPRRTVTYCQYGDDRMKPTDLWGYVEGWTHREPCKNGQSCHEAAPRGSKTGTQGRKDAKNRSMIPYELGLEILNACG